MSKVPYREAIGSLMHLALFTRLDILFAVTKLSQYNENPGREHWLQVKHILRYLSKTRSYGLTYKRNNNNDINVYCDADWGNDIDDRHSFSGLIVKIAGFKMFCDNRAAIDFSRSNIDRNKSKHIDISYHIVREKLEQGLMSLQYIPTDENPADMLTKGLKATKHHEYVKMLNLRSMNLESN
ncbi:secreted RxLR effector protein 161-like [Colletes gigas]|uniref:secreted RxLR effector protein 161-like n=1 Tax=Colletes gigas TaxID=935657 RepID=UPI001C9B073F|nr:secreted RxLR effector protein 161-like [Colletes gigas]